jgi:hypothetical protein
MDSVGSIDTWVVPTESADLHVFGVRNSPQAEDPDMDACALGTRVPYCVRPVQCVQRYIRRGKRLRHS